MANTFDEPGNKYLVDRMHLLQVGKQARPVEIDVHVLWQTLRDGGRKQFFWQNYSTTLTRRACQENPDALFTILTRRLPFAEWDYVFYGTHDFSHRLYELGLGPPVVGGTDMHECREWWRSSLFQERLGYGGRLYASLADQERSIFERVPHRDPEANMRSFLRDLVLREDGIARSENRRWWFVVHKKGESV